MKYSEKQALSKMAAYCSRAERAKVDIVKKLQNWELDRESIDRIITYLIKEKFLSEERYCRSFIKDKLRFNKWGRTKITFELRKKQIPSDIIELCFKEVDECDFQEQLTSILSTKLKSVKASNDNEKKMKLIRFALGRGYNFNEIKKCLAELFQNNNNDDQYTEEFF